MIEQAMIFALGFLVAGLLALLFLPAVQRRAARLSARRLEMLLPLSMEEIVAERDQLRAEFAVERRRIEQKLEAAAEVQAKHMGEIGRQTAAINELRAELANAREELRASGEAKDALHREMAEAEATVSAAKKALHDESSAHAVTREEREALRAQHLALEHASNEQRAALAGSETRAAALDLRIVALNHQKQELEKNLQRKTAEAEVLLVERDLARTEREGVETKRATLQRRLDEEALRAADFRDQIEVLRRRVDEAERARVTGEQARDTTQQRHDQAARKLEEQEKRIRDLQTSAAERQATQNAEIATLTGQLEAARRELASLQEDRRSRDSETTRKLQAEIGKAREAEAEWKSRNQKQAAEIAALTAVLEQTRQEHASSEQGSREREADWQARHASQRREIAGLVTFLDETQNQKEATPSRASDGATADLSTSQREETALLRQAIADLGSEVVRIAASLKQPDGSEDEGSRLPDLMDKPRTRARAQP